MRLNLDMAGDRNVARERTGMYPGLIESPRPWTQYARTALILLLTVQLIVVERGVLSGARFNTLPLPKALIAVAIAIVWLLAVASLTIWKDRHRNVRRVAIAAVVALSARFYSPVVLSTLMPPAQTPSELMAVDISPALVRFLRELAAAQEQYRLRYQQYSMALEPLRAWVRSPEGTVVRIHARGDTAWAARASLDGAVCTVWVRDSTLRFSTLAVEGSPHCGGRERRGNHQSIHSVTVPPSTESPFGPGDVGGEWLQHRADVHRSGVSSAEVSDSGKFAWTRSIGGSIRASAAIAGNQVFVGAHGNGEFVALSLDSGKVGFRIRAPNWVHHEPAVTKDLLVVGFGNNETFPAHPSRTGSPPSGVAVYDRRTGREQWRRYTQGSVMTTPIVADSIVAVVTGADEAVAWRLADGTPLWTNELPHYAPMGNPLAVDTLVVAGVEPTNVCVFGLRSGRKVYCRALAPQGWGAGHISPAVAGDAVFQVYEEDMDSTARREDTRAQFYVRKLFGIPPRRGRPRPADALTEQVLVALRLRDGRELWRVRLGLGRNKSSGHLAGTPTIADEVAYVPSRPNGAVVAVDTRTGRLLWSAAVKAARGSVLVRHGAVITATTDTAFVVLDARTGAVRCRQRLPQVSDRAGPAVSGATGVLTLRNGLVMARPLIDWIQCRT